MTNLNICEIITETAKEKLTSAAIFLLNISLIFLENC